MKDKKDKFFIGIPMGRIDLSDEQKKSLYRQAIMNFVEEHYDAFDMKNLSREERIFKISEFISEYVSKHPLKDK